MTGQNITPRGWPLFIQCTNDPEFNKDIEQLKQENEFVQINSITSLMLKYGLATSLRKCLTHYIKTGELNMSLAGDYIRLETNNGVALRLSFDTTQPELIAYIKANWAKLIKPELNKISGGSTRTNAVHKPELIHKAYLEHAKGKSVEAAANDNDVSISALRAYKKKQETK